MNCPIVAVGLLAFVASVSALDGSHWIVLPSKIVPGEPLPLSFTFFNTTDDVVVQVDLLKDDHHRLSTLRHIFIDGASEILNISVPSDIMYNASNPSKYTLLVHGLGGLYFTDHGQLEYHITAEKKNLFAVQIQTDKAIYKPGQTVQFRTFGLFSNMTVYTGEFNVSIYDPKGNHMKQMINVSEPNYGVVEDFLIMDTEPLLGSWRIVVSVDNMASKVKTFNVDKYVLPKFKASVQLPPYILISDTEVHGTVKAIYTYGKPVIGKVLLRADLDYYYSPWKYHGDEVMVEMTLDINGEAKFTVPLDRIANEVEPNSFVPLVQKLKGNHLIVDVSVTESLNNLTRNVSGKVQFYDQPFKMSFESKSSPTYFKPGLPYTAHVSLVQANGNPVISTDQDVRVVTYVKFYDEDLHQYRAHSLPDVMMTPPPGGILELAILPPNISRSLHIEVHYKGIVAKHNANKPYWLSDYGTIQLINNASVVTAGKTAAYTVQSINPIHELFFMIITDDLILHSGEVDGQGSTSVVVSFPVTEKMEPYGHLIVYYFDNLGEIWNADSLYFEVNEGTDVFKNKVSIDFDKKQAEPGDSVNLQVTTDPMSMVNVLAVDQSILLLATGNDVTQQDVMSSLKPASPPYSIYSSQLHDPQQVMQSSGMQILTDMQGFSWAHPYYKRQINCNPNFNGGSITGGTGAGTGGGSHLQTVERTRDFFPETWLWTNTLSRSDGTATINTTVPDTITSWVATAFSVNKQSGLGITESSAKFTTFRPFFINLNLPYSVVRGEEVVLQANVFNYMGQELEVVVTLDKSDDFRAILHMADGQVDYVNQDIVKTIKIKAGEAGSVFIPIIADIVGVADISIKAQTILSADGIRRQLIVEAEGTPMHFNIPVILNGNQPETVELSFPHKYVKDSERIRVSAVGDIMGPTIKNLDKLLYLPTGCGEQTMTSFSPDVYVYNYLKTTNQLTPKIAGKATDYMQRGYQRELTFQHSDGSFSIWGNSDYQGSMWLTAFVLKSFHQARPYIYVSDNVLNNAGRWISRYQQYDGSYRNIGSVHSTSLKGGANSAISLTAFVLIALQENDDVLTSYKYIQQSARARVYLEQHVHGMSNMYDLAITSYALSRSGSAQGAVAYAKLLTMSTVTSNGNRYWSSGSSSPRMTSEWDYYYYRNPPLDVEITSYALLFLIQTHQLSEGIPLLRWLVSQRNEMGGFRSTQDTVLGLQAMSEFGTLLSGNLDLNIGVGIGNFSQQMHIGTKDAMVLHIVDVPSNSLVSGTMSGTGPIAAKRHALTLDGKGTGAALVHVSVTFNVETEVREPSFNLTATVLHETLRSLVVETCAQYIVNKFTTAGMANIEIDVPTGFVAELESDVTKLPDVMKTEIQDQTVVLYYEEILPTEPTCATIEMLRAELVAKNKPAAVRVYDYYEPDNRGLDFYESSLLKASTVCDLCNDCGCPATSG